MTVSIPVCHIGKGYAGHYLCLTDVVTVLFCLLSGKDEHVRSCKEDCEGGGKDSSQPSALSCTGTGQSTVR